MPKAIIFTGIPASGKTSYYYKHFSDYVHINLDTMKTRNKEACALEKCILEKKNFVVDNTNPTVGDRQRYIQLASAAGYEIIGYYFSSPITQCIKRNSRRTGNQRIPDKGILNIYGKLAIPMMSEGFDELWYVRLCDDGFITKDRECAK